MSEPKLDLYATEYYYLDHMASVYSALEPHEQGTVFTLTKWAKRAREWGLTNLVTAKTRTQLAAKLRQHPLNPTLTASFANFRDCRKAGRRSPTLIHGQGSAGNSAPTWHKHKDQVECMLVPAPWGRTGLDLPVYECGGQPKLDRHLNSTPPVTDRPRVGLSFRWRESTSALSHYLPGLPKFLELCDMMGIEVVGHGHPRIFEGELRPLWKKFRVTRTADFEKILSNCHAYVADCSSTIFEFASLDRPVVLMDCPKYRKCKFPPRFTHRQVGLETKGPEELFETIMLALADPMEIALNRRAVVDELFSTQRHDGRASHRAAQILRTIFL